MLHKQLLNFALAASIAWTALSSCANAPTGFEQGQPTVLIDRNGVAIGGYDPVSYFLEGEARRGMQSLQVIHQGAIYWFSSTANQEAFATSPERYTPQFGGWCAWAVADTEGSLVEVDPKSFLIQDSQLLLFYDGLLADTRALWLKGNPKELARSAHRNWQRIAQTTSR